MLHRRQSGGRAFPDEEDAGSGARGIPGSVALRLVELDGADVRCQDGAFDLLREWASRLVGEVPTVDVALTCLAGSVVGEGHAAVVTTTSPGGLVLAGGSLPASWWAYPDLGDGVVRCRAAGRAVLGPLSRDGREWRVGFAPLPALAGHSPAVLVVGFKPGDGGGFDPATLEVAAAMLGVHLAGLRQGEMARSAGREEARAALAADLHDSLAQNLCYLSGLAARLEGALAGDEPVVAGALAGELRDRLGRACGELRELLSASRPGVARGLAPALALAVKDFERRSGVPATLVLGSDGAGVSLGVASEMLLVAGEALANVHRHAGAGRVAVRLDAVAGGTLRLRVDDDGIGFQPSVLAGDSGLGLGIMAERARRIGATLAVSRRPGGGTRVELRLPPAASKRGSGAEGLGVTA